MGSQGAGSNGGQAAGQKFVSFSRPAAQRIAKVVRTVEAGDRSQRGLEFDHPLPSGKQLRVCTFTGAWAINETKTLTFQGVTTTPNTVVATNQLFTIGDACQTQVAYIGKVSSSLPTNATASWHLLSVQHHATAVIVSVTLTTSALSFARREVWIPYPGTTATLNIPISNNTSCS